MNRSASEVQHTAGVHYLHSTRSSENFFLSHIACNHDLQRVLLLMLWAAERHSTAVDTRQVEPQNTALCTVSNVAQVSETWACARACRRGPAAGQALGHTRKGSHMMLCCGEALGSNNGTDHAAQANADLTTKEQAMAPAKASEAHAWRVHAAKEASR